MLDALGGGLPSSALASPKPLGLVEGNGSENTSCLALLAAIVVCIVEIVAVCARVRGL